MCARVFASVCANLVFLYVFNYFNQFNVVVVCKYLFKYLEHLIKRHQD